MPEKPEAPKHSDAEIDVPDDSQGHDDRMSAMRVTANELEKLGRVLKATVRGRLRRMVATRSRI